MTAVKQMQTSANVVCDSFFYFFILLWLYIT